MTILSKVMLQVQSYALKPEYPEGFAFGGEYNLTIYTKVGRKHGRLSQQNVNTGLLAFDDIQHY